MEAVLCRWRVGAFLLLLLLALLAGCATPQPMRFLYGADPVYPPEAQAAGVEGYVTLRYDVTAQGEVANPRVVESVPSGVFDAAALRAVSQWRFRPPMVSGRNVALRDRVSTLRFELGKADDYVGY